MGCGSSTAAAKPAEKGAAPEKGGADGDQKGGDCPDAAKPKKAVPAAAAAAPANKMSAVNWADVHAKLPTDKTDPAQHHKRLELFKQFFIEKQKSFSL